ncbi:unnamed protein product [Acanthoscelides obtectus]|uniref:Transposase n=1 Tax=Acanthoscelides obtectus TaxID=200917 RepID=A0A9P0NUR5_ACAOB|nr:unnamed protein product [Acanthoscelides obtectus]CAK1673695.1 hypothetical protein AOBTE_LOCUS29416 [Acanthoscelides obtectus]
MFHNRQNQNSDVIKTPADIDRLVADMNRLQVPKELKKLIVYVYERKIYGSQDAISREYLNFCLASYFILKTDQYESLLSDLQLMPMQRFIQKTVDLLSFRPGLHKEVLDFIEIKYEAFPKQAREITLLLDDVEITPGLTGIAGNLYGNVDDGISHNHTPAKYVTQIWIRSLIASDCFDLLAYYFTSQHATAEQLKNYIFECITKLQAINLDVVLVNTKLKSNFWELSELLGIGPQKQTFKVENKEVVFIFDAPHMMCVTRNNLQKHYLKMEDGGTTSWEHIKTFFVKESGSGQKKTPLTAVHIEPHKFDRITPSLAIDVLSNTVYTEMKSYVESGKLPEEALATVQCITLFDRVALMPVAVRNFQVDGSSSRELSTDLAS